MSKVLLNSCRKMSFFSLKPIFIVVVVLFFNSNIVQASVDIDRNGGTGSMASGGLLVRCYQATQEGERCDKQRPEDLREAFPVSQFMEASQKCPHRIKELLNNGTLTYVPENQLIKTNLTGWEIEKFLQENCY